MGHLENLEHNDSVVESSDEYLYNEESSEFEDGESEIRHYYTPSLLHHSSDDDNQNLIEELRQEIAVLKIQAVFHRIRHINPPFTKI